MQSLNVAEKRRLLAEKLARAGRTSTGRTGPVSFAQRRLWIIDSLLPGNRAYNVPVVLRTSTPPDPAALADALEVVIRRHEVLRTVFVSSDGVPVQRVGPEYRPAIETRDVSAEDDPGTAADQVVHSWIRLPFDLAAGPLLRVLLVQVAPDEHLVVLTVHHIVCDGWSIETLFRELDALYAQMRDGTPADLPKLEHQYIDYAIWQRGRLSGPRLGQLTDYWRDRLDGAPGLLQLPLDAARPVHATANAGSHQFTYSRQLRDDILAFAAATRTTPSVVVLVCFDVLLQRFCAQDDIVVGVPAAGQTHSALQGMIGYFVNTLVMRMDLAGHPSLNEAVRRGHDFTAGMFANQDMPFEKLVVELQSDRYPTVTPIFQVMFNFQTASNDRRRLPNLDADLVPFDSGLVRFDLEFNMFVSEDGMGGTWLFNRDLLSPAAVARMAVLLERLLSAAMARPDVPLDLLNLFDSADLAEFARVGGTVATDPSACPEPRSPATPVIEVGRHIVFRDGAAVSTPDAGGQARRWVVDELVPAWRGSEFDPVPRGAADRRRAGFDLSPGGVVVFAAVATTIELDEAAWALDADARLILVDDVNQGLLDTVLPTLMTETVDTLCIAPGLLRGVVDAVEHGDLAPTVRRILSTHEPLSAELEARCLRALPDTELWTVYRVAGIGDVAWRRCANNRPAGHDVVGTVCPGIAVRIRDADGGLLPIGAPGVVWVDGALPDEVDTGDLGRFREDGTLEVLGAQGSQVYLRQVRVLRGEVECVLAAHKSVDDVRVLPAADSDGTPRLVAYLVLARGTQSAGEIGGEERARLRDDVRAHAQRLLPGMVVPSTYMFLDALPLDARGRVDLETLRTLAYDEGEGERVDPHNDTEQLLVDIWRDVLGIDEIGVHDNFFLLGGHSLLAIQLVNRLQQATRIDLPVSALYRYRTVADLAARVVSMSGETGSDAGNLVQIQAGPEPVPVVAVHPAGGAVFCYTAMAAALTKRTVYALEGREPGPSLTALAAKYLDQLPEEVLNAPFMLLGWSFGGVMAFEMARTHVRRGRQAVPVTMIDSALFEGDPAAPDAEARLLAGYLESVRADFGLDMPQRWDLDGVPPQQVFANLLDRLGSAAPEVLDLAEMTKQYAVYRSHLLNLTEYRPSGEYSGPVHLFQATESPRETATAWRAYAPELVVRRIEGDHYSILRNPRLATVVAEVERQLAGLDVVRGFVR